jgi:hypothetical protein
MPPLKKESLPQTAVTPQPCGTGIAGSFLEKLRQNRFDPCLADAVEPCARTSNSEASGRQSPADITALPVDFAAKQANASEKVAASGRLGAQITLVVAVRRKNVRHALGDADAVALERGHLVRIVCQ